MINTSKIEYLDHAATSPLDDRVLKAMLPYFSEVYGNASSNHAYGSNAKEVIDNSRAKIADIFEVTPKEISFTSGATEAINLGIKGYVEANNHRGNHIITVKTEHKAVLATCEYLETVGYEVSYLDVNEHGVLEIETLRAALTPKTILAAIMLVNNETGIIQPIETLSKVLKQQQVALFCDATQAIGKTGYAIDPKIMGIDLMCFSAHKFRGPKGIGGLYVNEDITITPQIHGGGQENGLRGGTYNTPLIVGLSEALILAFDENRWRYSDALKKRNEIINYYETNNIGTVNFKSSNTVPYILSITLNQIEADMYLLKQKNKFAAATGSACNAAIIEPSHVLRVIEGIEPKKVIRISF